MAVPSLLFLSFQVARADIGPPPPCPSGTHRQYLRGHHCVKDGHHLESDPDNGTVEVPDEGTQAPPSATSPAPPPIVAAPVPPATQGAPPLLPTETASAPPASDAPVEDPLTSPTSGGGCAAAPGAGAPWSVLLGLALLLRRRSRRMQVTRRPHEGGGVRTWRRQR